MRNSTAISLSTGAVASHPSTSYHHYTDHAVYISLTVQCFAAFSMHHSSRVFAVAQEIATHKYSLMPPNKAAVELKSLLGPNQALSDFELRRRMSIVGSHLQLPSEASHLSAARKAVLWAHIFPAVRLMEVHSGTILYEAGTQGDCVIFLLTGSVTLGTTSQADPACWQPFGKESLAGQPYS